MYICCKDFNLFVDGECFSFIKGQKFEIEDAVTVKRLLANQTIVKYNYNEPAIVFSRAGIKFQKIALETK